MPTQTENLIRAFKFALDELQLSERVAGGLINLIPKSSISQLNNAVSVTSSKDNEYDFGDILDKMGFTNVEGGGIDNALINIFLLFTQAIPILLQSANPAIQRSNQFWNTLFPNQNLNNVEAFLALSRSIISSDKYLEILAESGMYTEFIKNYDEIIRPRATEDELVRAHFLGLLDENYIVNEFMNRGFNKVDAEVKLRSRRFQFQPQDVIRLTVREAFSDEAVRRFNLDEEFPTNAIELAERVGMDAEQLRFSWRAHWQLVSPQQAFDMFQRLRNPSDPRHFGIQDLRRYLKFADYPAFFRDRLEAISRPTLPRVDIRRAFKSGGYDVSWVSERYRDLGYDEDNVKALTLIATNEGTATERELTRAAIQDLYEARELSRSEAKQMLVEIGQSNESAEFYLIISDIGLQKQDIKESLDSLEERYIDFVIDDGQLENELGRLNVSGDRKDTLKRQWKRRRDSKLKLPSKTDLESWYKKSIINEEEFDTSIKQLGYTSEHAKNYRNDIEIEMADSARKEEERSAKELQREFDREIRNVERLEKAILQTEIAQRNVSIAEIKLALHENVSDEIKQDLSLLHDQLKLEIAEIQVNIARLPITILESV